MFKFRFSDSKPTASIRKQFSILINMPSGLRIIYIQSIMSDEMLFDHKRSINKVCISALINCADVQVPALC